jgi:hypothetical protein
MYVFTHTYYSYILLCVCVYIYICIHTEVCDALRSRRIRGVRMELFCLGVGTLFFSWLFAVASRSDFLFNKSAA